MTPRAVPEHRRKPHRDAMKLAATTTLPTSMIWLRLVILLIAVVLFPGAAGDDYGDNEVDAEDHRLFADSFCGKLYEKKNECSSTWGVSMCMDLIRPGGDADVKDDLCNGMALCSDSGNGGLLWEGAVNRLTKKYDGTCGKKNGNVKEHCPVLKVANSVWIDESSQLDEDYEDIVGDFLHEIDFTDRAAGQEINNWVKVTTEDLIDKIIEPGQIMYDLVAVNSIYLKAVWAKQFKKDNTNMDRFYTGPSRKDVAVQGAHFMHQVQYFDYSATALPPFQLIKLPYQNSRMSMIIALPKKAGAGTPTTTDVVAALPKLQEEYVALGVPKFKFESTYKTEQIKKAFDAVGISSPFEGLHFCNLVENLCLYIEEMIQKTSIEIDEKGTVAAAVTAALMPRSIKPPPVEFLADHPFFFFIYDEKEDLVLFEGRVGQPEAPNGSKKTPLKWKHSNSKFWKKALGVQPKGTRSTTKKAATFKQCRNRMKAGKGRCCKKPKGKARRKCFAGIMKNRCSMKLYRNRSKGSTKARFQEFLKNACRR